MRDGVTGADVVPIAAMIDAFMNLHAERSDEMWRRYPTIILDGLRARPDQAPLRDAGGTG
ncbi:hypothetical protein ACFXPV_23615 [Streptomyces sp. NPDC059118]|uniref:hypothetical protein n=1 Tax=unclassified Streptomyces TaxID=2593676 RepID=UPI00367BE852